MTRWASIVGPPESVHGADVTRLRPRCPLLILSGATPGPFYHSHPHVPAQFDHLRFDMESQVRCNIATIRSVADALADNELPFPFDRGRIDEFCHSVQLLHWVSNRGAGFEANALVTADVTKSACREHGMNEATVLATFETGGNVSDRRFLIETFGLFGLEGVPHGPAATSVRIDLKSQFDGVDETTSMYTVGADRHFMPYVPGYVVTGPADLAVFTLTAASGEQSAPEDGAQQVELVIEKLCHVLEALGATFDDVVMLWNRCAELDKIEDAVLMSRAEKGLTRPLAESVLEIVESDPNPRAPDGTALAIEYIVVAQVPTCGRHGC